MRLESITVRNYRVHRERTVEFNPARTLIGGPNESGKSTLIEAAHRALFLRAKTGGKIQKSMVSRMHAGHPEVELCFSACGRRWRLLKRFSGASGTAALAEIGGDSWSGDEAEEKLGELLGVEIAGRRGVRHVDEQWAHLWIWQGCASEDPTTHANTHCADLLARLQREGGAAAVQSECDQRVAAAVAERFGAIFKSNGEARAGSPLAQAEAAEASAGEALAVARHACEWVERGAADFIAAEKDIRSAADAIAQLQPQQRTVEEKLARVAALRGEEKVQAPAAATAEVNYDTFAKADACIRELRMKSEKTEAEFVPIEAETARLIGAEVEVRKADTDAEAAWQQASEAMRAARQRNELADAHVRRIEKTEARDQLAKRLEQMRVLRKELAAHEAALAESPAITATTLRALQQLEGELARATAARDAMAAGIEVLASDEPVRVAGRVLAAGDAEILTEETEVEIGTASRLRIRPGGGTTLAEARERVRHSLERFQRELDRCALASIEAATEALARRQQIESEIKATQARLDVLGADKIEEAFAKAEAECAAATAEVGRRSALIDNTTAPATLEAARALLSESVRQLRESEQRESSARAGRKVAADKLRAASERLETQRQSFQNKRQQATSIAAQLRLLVETHGEDTARGTRLVELSAERTKAQALLEGTRRALAELQPALLERDGERLTRALAHHAAAQRDAEEKRATARGELQRDGFGDPRAELALAEARLRSATEQREREQRHADAIALLHELFLDEQKALAEQFTRPLATRISGYLECLFGSGARAEVTIEANNFCGLRLIRPSHGDGAFDFEHLSGGTREQLAAAVRLALAEVLAAAHDGSLPVVFDDAFAYSDPERVRVLQRMLDIAAERGLQIIVLSCNPADYAALGAKVISLQLERIAPGQNVAVTKESADSDDVALGESRGST